MLLLFCPLSVSQIDTLEFVCSYLMSWKKKTDRLFFHPQGVKCVVTWLSWMSLWNLINHHLRWTMHSAAHQCTSNAIGWKDLKWMTFIACVSKSQNLSSNLSLPKWIWEQFTAAPSKATDAHAFSYYCTVRAQRKYSSWLFKSSLSQLKRFTQRFPPLCFCKLQRPLAGSWNRETSSNRTSETSIVQLWSQCWLRSSQPKTLFAQKLTQQTSVPLACCGRQGLCVGCWSQLKMMLNEPGNVPSRKWPLLPRLRALWWKAFKCRSSSPSFLLIYEIY